MRNDTCLIWHKGMGMRHSKFISLTILVITKLNLKNIDIKYLNMRNSSDFTRTLSGTKLCVCVCNY